MTRGLGPSAEIDPCAEADFGLKAALPMGEAARPDVLMGSLSGGRAAWPVAVFHSVSHTCWERSTLTAATSFPAALNAAAQNAPFGFSKRRAGPGVAAGQRLSCHGPLSVSTRRPSGLKSAQ